jgi:hypothetical protein
MKTRSLVDFFATRATDLVCFASPDLTTNNNNRPPDGPTTPEDNALPQWPKGAFMPRTDRDTIAPDPPHRTAIAKPVPGVQVQGRFAGDPSGQGRFLLRFPDDWNGKLVLAGASGNRSEFNGDSAWSDFVIQKGYAYASQNKGVLNLFRSTESDPLACRLGPSSKTCVRFYAHDPEKPFSQWTEFMLSTARLAQDAAAVHYRERPQRTYAVGTSNGGYQVRRALEQAPELFDGGVDWEGTFIDPEGPNLLIELPVALKNFPAYAAAGFDPNCQAARKIRAAGYPPDILNGKSSLWELYYHTFWEVTLCQWQKRLDPAYDTYRAGPENYNFAQRAKVSAVQPALAAIATTGRLTKPLVSIAGTLDALTPTATHARAYRARVLAWRQCSADYPAAYRLYEVQNGNHIDAYRALFPQLELMQPHVHRAFDLLVNHVEHGAPLPPDQCIPRGGQVLDAPVQPGCCADLLVQDNNLR